MQVYNLIEFGGEYEDYYEHLVGCYLSKEKAEQDKKFLEEKEREVQKKRELCNRCPCEYDAKTEDKEQALCEDCSLKVEVYDEERYYCENSCISYDNKYYIIKLVDVIDCVQCPCYRNAEKEDIEKALCVNPSLVKEPWAPWEKYYCENGVAE